MSEYGEVDSERQSYNDLVTANKVTSRYICTRKMRRIYLSAFGRRSV